MSHDHIDPDIVNAGTKPDMGYEIRDTEQYMGPIVKVSFWFFAISVVIMILMIPTMNLLLERGPSFKMQPISEIKVPALPTEPNPLIQGDKRVQTDMYNHRKKETMAKNSYGWVDEKKGIGHIPVEEALKEVAREGLPTGGTTTP